MKIKKMHKYLGMALVLSFAVTAAGCAKKTETTVKNEPAAAQVQVQTGETEISTETQPGTQAEGQIGTEEVVKAETGEASSLLLHVISGTVTVTDEAADTVTISTDKYPQGVTFSRKNAATGFANVLAVGQEITIFYCGDIKDGDASGVSVELFRDKREMDQDAQAATVSGTVTAIGMSVITIETVDGRSISFEQDPKPVNMTTGPVEGDKVTILYSYQDEGQEGAVAPELIRN